MTRTLADWLAWIEAQHSRPIDMGLERVVRVRDAMAVRSAAVVITVAGTNGKGSTCALLEAILRAAGYRVGLYTSPHLLRYNERVRLLGRDAEDAALCDAFAAVEAARGDTTLTYFEFGTLAAWWLFCQQALDVVILEIGLGGRLDAVNAIEPDCVVVTGVAMDHMEYLGDTREAIGFEKAGVFRAGKPAIVGEPQPPQSVLDRAAEIGADLWLQGRDFRFNGDRQQWHYAGRHQRRNSMAYPALRGANQLLNASTALAVLEAIGNRLPVGMQAVREGLMYVEWPGRFQVLPGRPVVVLDVAHNPQSVAVLAENLASMGFHPNTFAVCGMLADKDIAGSLRAIIGRIDRWYLCDLPGPRGASAQQLVQALQTLGCKAEMLCFASPAQAFQTAREAAEEGDRIAAFGSFLTVAEVMQTATQRT